MVETNFCFQTYKKFFVITHIRFFFIKKRSQLFEVARKKYNSNTGIQQYLNTYASTSWKLWWRCREAFGVFRPVKTTIIRWWFSTVCCWISSTKSTCRGTCHFYVKSKFGHILCTQANILTSAMSLHNSQRLQFSFVSHSSSNIVGFEFYLATSLKFCL